MQVIDVGMLSQACYLDCAQDVPVTQPGPIFGPAGAPGLLIHISGEKLGVRPLTWLLSQACSAGQPSVQDSRLPISAV